MAAKKQMTQAEIEKIIMDRCVEEGMHSVTSVMVAPENAMGWTANFAAAPHLVLQYQPGFHAIVNAVRDLRSKDVTN